MREFVPEKKEGRDRHFPQRFREFSWSGKKQLMGENSKKKKKKTGPWEGQRKRKGGLLRRTAHPHYKEKTLAPQKGITGGEGDLQEEAAKPKQTTNQGVREEGHENQRRLLRR